MSNFWRYGNCKGGNLKNAATFPSSLLFPFVLLVNRIMFNFKPFSLFLLNETRCSSQASVLASPMVSKNFCFIVIIEKKSYGCDVNGQWEKRKVNHSKYPLSSLHCSIYCLRSIQRNRSSTRWQNDNDQRICYDMPLLVLHVNFWHFNFKWANISVKSFLRFPHIPSFISDRHNSFNREVCHGQSFQVWIVIRSIFVWFNF